MNDAPTTEDRFLLFWVGSELYGTPLLDVREVVEYQEPKFMPNMVGHFAGVINIRGSIVGVADLRKKFNQKTEVNRFTAFLVCDTEQGPLAATVDRVESVVSIPSQDLEQKPPVVTHVDTSYLLGIAKIKDRLATIIQLQKTMSEDHLIRKGAA
jgi:purine-binding chemotaxis protein CheW